MKKLILFALAFALVLMPLCVSGQSKPGIGKPFFISAKVSEDGKTLIPASGEAWSVVNPGALAGHEGQQVKVKCQLSSASHDIRVLSLKVVATQVRYAANPGDSAFRR